MLKIHERKWEFDVFGRGEAFTFVVDNAFFVYELFDQEMNNALVNVSSLPGNVAFFVCLPCSSAVRFQLKLSYDDLSVDDS